MNSYDISKLSISDILKINNFKYCGDNIFSDSNGLKVVLTNRRVRIGIYDTTASLYRNIIREQRVWFDNYGEKVGDYKTSLELYNALLVEKRDSLIKQIIDEK